MWATIAGFHNCCSSFAYPKTSRLCRELRIPDFDEFVSPRSSRHASPREGFDCGVFFASVVHPDEKFIKKYSHYILLLLYIFT